MDNETNLDSLFEDALTPETPADDNGTQAAEETTQEQQKEPMPPEERAKQAADRRGREQRAYNQGYQQARAEMSELLKRVGITNSKDEAIDTVDSLEKYDREQSDRRLATGSGNADDFRRIVREEMQAVQPRPDPLNDPEIQRELAQIKAMDPAMTNIDAILASEAGERFRGYVDRGLTFVEAYKLAASDRLASINANRAGAKGSGKAHLNATQQQGTGALSVPADELALFRELNPGTSDADIQKYYNADRKRYGPK